jgi:hypothetical protein
MRFTIAALILLLAGCTWPVKLRNPATCETVRCGPYFIQGGRFADGDARAKARVARCVADFERQGFERVP